MLPDCQGRRDFAAWQVDDVAAGGLDHFAAEAGDTHLQALVVLQAVDVLVEPAAHLDAGVARREEFAAQFGIHLVGQFLAAAELQPGVLFLNVHDRTGSRR